MCVWKGESHSLHYVGLSVKEYVKIKPSTWQQVFLGNGLHSEQGGGGNLQKDKKM